MYLTHCSKTALNTSIVCTDRLYKAFCVLVFHTMFKNRAKKKKTLKQICEKLLKYVKAHKIFK